MIDISAAQVYTPFFVGLLFAAPALVGIITPLISPVVRDLERGRLGALRNLEKAKNELAKAHGDGEVKKAKKKLKTRADEYKYFKNLRYRLDGSIILGMAVPIICAVGIFDIFGLMETAGPLIFLVIAVVCFIVESIALLSLVWIHALSERTEIVKKLSNARK